MRNKVARIRLKPINKTTMKTNREELIEKARQFIIKDRGLTEDDLLYYDFANCDDMADFAMQTEVDWDELYRAYFYERLEDMKNDVEIDQFIQFCKGFNPTVKESLTVERQKIEWSEELSNALLEQFLKEHPEAKLLTALCETTYTVWLETKLINLMKVKEEKK